MEFIIKLKDSKFCDGCKFQIMPEDEQNARKIKMPFRHSEHWCWWYRIQLTHGEKHPLIPRLQKCIKEHGK